MDNIEFFERNKNALIEEIGSSIVETNSILNEIINNGKKSRKRMKNKNLLIALGHKVGYMSAVYNQLFVLINGKEEKEEKKKIGFNSLTDFKG